MSGNFTAELRAGDRGPQADQDDSGIAEVREAQLIDLCHPRVRFRSASSLATAL